MTNTIKIGWIGLGNMGIPMSLQLLKAGYPVLAYNRNKEKEAMVTSAGADKTSEPADLIKRSDVVIIMVTDDNAIREIFSGKNGLLGAGTSGKYIINMSTVSPAISREMSALCAAQGNHYLDAPVSGSVKQAEEGQLVIMAGGDEASFSEVKPILEKMGKLVMLLGPAGAGNTAKLAINTLLAIHAQALAETMVFAGKNGVNISDLSTLINNGAMGNPFNKIKGDAIIQQNFKAAFSLKNIVKDLRLASDLGLDTPLGLTAMKTFEAAEPAFGNEDLIAVIKSL